MTRAGEAVELTLRHSSRTVERRNRRFATTAEFSAIPAETSAGAIPAGLASLIHDQGKKVLFALLLGFAVSTTSVSCVPIVNIPSCPAGGSFVGC